MAPLLLDCPLCCSETFTCHNSLKYHLLSISDNLLCPSCEKRFEKIVDLAMHLGRQCKDSEEEPVEVESAQAMNKDLQVVEIQIKEENMENASVGVELEVTDSILATALMKTGDKADDVIENNSTVHEINDDTVIEDVVYHCSSCAISFTCIEEHLQKYHEGHQVFLQDSKDEEITETETANGVDVENTVEDSTLVTIENEEEYGEEGDVNDNSEILKELKSPEFLKTLEEQECVDKDGCLYTRRLVKIEKFWDEKEMKVEASESEKFAALAHANSTEHAHADSTEQPDVLQSLPVSNSGDDDGSILEIYQCANCSRKFASLNAYSDHRCATIRGKSKYKKCQLCKYTFIDSKYLAVHMKTHNAQIPEKTEVEETKAPFVCEICNTEFSTYKSKRLHKRMHDPVRTKDIEPPVSYGMLGEQLINDDVPREMFICELCNKPYNKEYEEAHKKFHSNVTDFNCDICNRKFFTQENLDMHMRAHSDAKKFSCSYCKKGFLTSDKLEAHMSTKCHKRQYECQYCGRRFARPHEKVKHERIHTGEKPHVCEICGKAFRVSYCLTLHMRTHSGTRPYKCVHCGKRFKAHSVYNHHLLTHSEDRKYKCPYCPKTFKTGVQLAGHKNSHTKPFTCTECNRPFASLYAVRAHMETHQRQNNLKYKCWLCGASYARAFALRDHVREQHVNERNNADPDSIIFDDYISENIETNEPILGDAGESMLIDIGGGTVENMEIPDVVADTQVTGDT